MKTHSLLSPLRRASMVTQALVLAAAALLPALALSNTAHGAQLDNRFVDMSANQTSEGSGRDGGDTAGQDVTYRVEFDLGSSHTVDGIVIDFCSNSPITGDACTAPTGFDVNEGTLVATEVSAFLNANFALDADTDANTIVFTDETTGGDALTAGDTITLEFGTSAAGDGITNPTSAGSFYARILTYTSDVTAGAYAPATPGAFTDDGGVAMSVANELTITARVQEVLEFCIGTDTDSSLANVTGDDCTNVAGTNLDLGVVDANSIQKTSDGDILNDGVFLIRTNALSGAVIYYKAEQETGLTNGGEGTLRQTGLDDCGTISAVNNVCFNSAGGDVANPTAATITAGTELFGMTLRDLNTTSGGATTAVTCDAEYRAVAACDTTAATDYAWDPTGAFDTIASSTGPIDDEKASIEFAATASPTTPTGLYTVTANFVATSTF